MTDQVRLNGAKRSALKKEHWKVVLQTPCEQKDELLEATTRFFSTQTDVHEICKKVVDERFPKADLDTMRKYNSSQDSGYYNSRQFTAMDSCFVLKNVESDDREIRVSFELDEDLAMALNHDRLSASGRNPFVDCQYNANGGVSSPQINTDRSSNNHWLKENFNQTNGGYGCDEKNPFSLEVVNTGGCHSRAYTLQDWQWNYVLAYEQAKKDVIQSHQDYYSFCKESQDTMNTVIDQAKFLSEVQKYWSDIDESILINGDNISTNLAVVSEDRLEQLKAMAEKRKANKPDMTFMSGVIKQA